MRHAANTVSAVFILNIRMLIHVSWPTMQTLVIYSTQQFDQDLHDLLSGNLYYKKIYFDNHVLIEKKKINIYIELLPWVFTSLFNTTTATLVGLLMKFSYLFFFFCFFFLL